MSGRCRRKNKNKSYSRSKYSTHSEFTLNEYANADAPNPSCRLKKSVANAVYLKSKIIKNSMDVLLSEKDTDKDWYDRNEEDLIYTMREIDEVEEDVVLEKKTKHAGILDKKGHQLHAGIRYPLDIWYIIAPFIHPEDVSTFFRLCKDSYSLSGSSHFWRKLYLRYCHLQQEHLPDVLHEYCIERKHGLCQRVIRSLFHVYPPFTLRNSTHLRFQDQPHSLIGRMCLFTWQEQETVQSKKIFLINFKLKNSIKKKSKKTSAQQRCLDFDGDDDDNIHHNDENHCCVLQVTCQNFIPVPPCMGLYLRHARMRISQTSMRYYSLQLVFDSGVAHASPYDGHVTGQDTVVMLDPVIDIRVFNWWHPKYPHYSV